MSWKCFVVLSFVGVLVIVRPSEAWFEQCSHNINLNAGSSMYINSPGYPGRYPSGSSCRYVITAPIDQEINVQCSIALDKGANSCGTEYFYVSTEGDTDLTDSEYFCGSGYVQRKSLFRTVTIAYTSSSTSAGGSFSCLVQSNPQPCDCGWSTTTRIVGGTEAQVNEFPLMAAIIYIPQRLPFCGATIISHRALVTAAHCFGNYNTATQLAALVGEHDMKTGAETRYTALHPVQSIRVHEYYDPSTNQNDIALVFTQTNIEWSRGVGPACLPFLYSYATFDGLDVEIAGWGTTSYGGPTSTVLMKATTTVASNSNCQSVISGLTSSQMCTYSPPQDSCQYDSGGPLIRRFQRLFIVGIISYGQGCGATAPAVNTRVTSYLDWIQNNVGETLCRKN
ncbi:unnamed protein product [Hermetia illucens]|uniref:Uncharacterized protein n=1 Tax=Hermetia illucens TaxID=343691 RepID=A0A7R8UY96_HERIL|nr:venom serine protease-like [Hermetia illucens]CAD7089370.1 unnamed protein product [Hermetia illucens]